jgi:parvulin-like peptidyl-prolyl isomerase
LRTQRFTFAAAAALLASALAFAGCNGTTGGDSGDTETAATVNGVAIPVSKIDQLIDRQLKAGGPSAQPLTPVALAAARLQILEQLVQQEALYQRAQKENVIPNDQEVQQALQQQIQGSRMTQEQYQQRLKELGQTEEDLKQEIKRELAVQKLQEKVTATIPAPSDAELQKYFEENRQALVAPRGVSLSDIIVDPQANGATDDAVGAEAAARKAQEISTQLKGGGDFATVARARSEDQQSALQGGVIGFFSESNLQRTFPPEVAARLFTMQPGQVTEPIQSGDGRWHLFKLDTKREQTKELTFEEVRDQIAGTITEQRRQVVMSALLLDAIAQADVKNNLADRIIKHPDTFGALRPSPLTQGGAGGAAPATPPANANAAATAPPPSNTAPAEAQPSGPANANR